jgi:hypothetical protein
MGARLAGITAAVGLILGRVTVTDYRGMQRIRRSDAGRPGRTDRRENLHHHGDQDDRKKFSYPAAHQTSSTRLPTNHAVGQVSRSGFRERSPIAAVDGENKTAGRAWQ